MDSSKGPESSVKSSIGAGNGYVNDADAVGAIEAEHELSVRQALKTYHKAVFWCIIACMSTIMESYDNMIIGSFYAYPSFQKRFGEKLADGDYTVSANWQLGLSAGTNVSMIIGGFLSGWLVDQFGPRRVMLVSHASLIGFIFITFFAPNLPVLLVGEILCGLPWYVQTTLVLSAAN